MTTISIDVPHANRRPPLDAGFGRALTPMGLHPGWPEYNLTPEVDLNLSYAQEER